MKQTELKAPEQGGILGRPRFKGIDYHQDKWFALWDMGDVLNPKTTPEIWVGYEYWDEESHKKSGGPDPISHRSAERNEAAQRTRGDPLVAVEKVPFRLLQTPCCSTLLCWVNPRFPTYCPECGKRIYPEIRSCITLSDPSATLTHAMGSMGPRNQPDPLTLAAQGLVDYLRHEVSGLNSDHHLSIKVKSLLSALGE